MATSHVNLSELYPDDAERISAAEKNIYTLRNLCVGGELNSEESAALDAVLNTVEQMAMDMQILQHAITRQAFDGMFAIAGHVWAAEKNLHPITDPLISHVVDIAANLVQEIYKR